MTFPPPWPRWGRRSRGRWSRTRPFGAVLDFACPVRAPVADDMIAAAPAGEVTKPGGLYVE